MWDIRVTDETVSTNDDAMAIARSGGPSRTVCVARRQTGGHGRFDRVWFSPAGKGLYCSVILRPSLPAEHFGLLSFCAATAMAETVRAEIKWPNDIIMNGRKICGILSSWGYDRNSEAFAVIGSGLNILAGSYPPELAEKAACLEDFGMDEPWDAILSRYLPLLESSVQELETRGFAEVRRRLEERCVILGKPVLVSGGQQAEGLAEGIGPQGELLVRLSSGSLVSVTCGDVSVRGVNGYV